MTFDVLGYLPLMSRLSADADGFAARGAWFAATVEHEYPDGPARIWDAFHDRMISPAEVMFTTLRLLGKEVELVRFPAESHELTRSGNPVHRVQRFELVLEWFDRYLK